MLRAPMSATSFFIVFLLISPLLILSVSGDEASDTSLEARDIGASFSANEIVSITWRNINTSNSGLLDDLHDSTYQIERLTMADSTIASTSIIANNIAACEIGDNNAACSAKNHSIEWMPPEGTNGSFKYRITTFTPNGPTTNFTAGFSQTVNNQSEIVSAHWGPTNMSAIYSAQSKSTIITWDNLPDVHSDTQIWVWRHSQPATRSNWDSLNKSAIQTFFDTSIISCIKGIDNGIERSVYYSITYDNGTFSDTRFMRDNTMASPVYEDTITPELVAQLSATFNPQSGITSLHWDSGAVDSNLVATIWRSPQSISNITMETVVAVVSVDGRLTSYDHYIGAGELGYFWYAVTLKDSVGNSITSLSTQHPLAGPIFESTVGEANTTVPSNVSAQQIDEVMISITWTDVSIVSNALYHIWASYAGPITQTSFDNGEVEYLGNSPVEMMMITTAIPPETERNVWYAVTVEGAWGGSQATYENRLIIGGINSMTSPVFADNLAPVQISNFNATFVGPSQSILLDWGHVDNASEYQLWIKTGMGLTGPWWNVSEDEGWILLSQYNASGQDMTAILDYSPLGQYAVLALLSLDASGHSIHELYGAGPVESIILDSTPPQGIFELFFNSQLVDLIIAENDSQLDFGNFSSDGELAVKISSYEQFSGLYSRIPNTQEWTSYNISLLENGVMVSLPNSTVAGEGVFFLDVKMVDMSGNIALFNLQYSWTNQSQETECPDLSNYCQRFVCKGEPEPEIPQGCVAAIPMCNCDAQSMSGSTEIIFPALAMALLAFVLISTFVASGRTSTEQKTYEEE